MSLSPPMDWQVALARLLDGTAPLGTEMAALAKASGRYLAADIHARRTQPAADLSAMDGYATQADDLAGPWRVVGESAAGHPYAGSLQPGEAIRISTGALMPAGSGAVLLQENALRDGDRLELSCPDGPTARHVRRKGFDFAEGAPLLAAGTQLTPAGLALALSAGHGQALVGQRPNVAVIDSGDELAANPQSALPHQIPASNGAMLAAMAAPLCSKVVRIGPVRDSLDDLVGAFNSAGDAHVIVTSGGASVGDHDLLRPALEQWGATIDFWRIAIKPGKPLLVARKGSTVILGLPGNPVSSHVTAFLFLLPLLRHLGGALAPQPRALMLPLGADMPAVGNRTEFTRVRIGANGVTPVTEQDSSALRALADADALVRREMGAAAAKCGDLMPVYLLQNGGIA